MTILYAVTLLALWTGTMRYVGRSTLFPPVILSIVWTVTLIGVGLFGDAYYPVKESTIVLVIVGVLAFSLGGLVAIRVPVVRFLHESSILPERVSIVRRSLRWIPFLLLLNLPFFLFYLGRLSSTIVPRENLWLQVRMASIRANVGGGGMHIEGSILPLISFMALLGVYEWTQTRQDTLYVSASFALATFYHLVNGSRSDILLLAVSAVTILWINLGGPPRRILLSGALIFAMLFAVNQLAMGKLGAGSEGSAEENTSKLGQGVTTYWVGGIIAFDQFRQNPELKYGWDLNGFAIRIANKFGGSFLQHERDLQYTKVSPTQVTNVYSVFLPYYMQTYTAEGVVWLMLAVGFVSTWVYRCAINGCCWAIFVAGTLIFATLMTFFSDEYFAQTTFMLKMAVLSSLVYFLPPFRRTVRL
jgi:oligosaccharide repeat unit polymerase